jgi:serine/threonine-protein kinase
MLGLVHRRNALAFSLLLALVASPGGLSAQSASEQKAAAEALFDRGLSLMREGKLAQACEQLEASQAIERGIGTMLYLAECYEKLGRTASAWALFREASSAAEASGQRDRAATGAQRAQALQPQLSTLTVDVPETSRVAGLEVRRNGALWPEGSWGVAVPVDPGRHRISASAPGHQTWEQEVEVGQQVHQTLSLPALAQGGPLPTPPPAEPAPASEIGQAEPPAETSAAAGGKPGSGDTMRIAGLITAGVGVVAIGVGGIFGLQAISDNSDAEELCPQAGACSSREGVMLGEDAQDAATLANVFVIGGVALAATGAILYFVAPEAERPAVAFGAHPHGAALQLGGVF